ncbi:MAG: NPCBM/NEW2 domain-containing protein [Planctomycetaceae bacterium]|nr:NPCBM/NEW2 domain-containing protein [Planctomycetaceae bacterium]
MNLSNEQLNRLFELCGALREEVITEEGFAELNSLLETNPAAQDIYLDYIYLCTDLCRLQAAIHSGQAACDTGNAIACDVLTIDMLKVLGEYEKEAETLELVPDVQSASPVRVASVQKVPRTVSKLSIFTFVTSLAALLLLIAYVYLNPRNSFEVASLADSIDAQWSSSLPLKQGTRLAVGGQNIHLQKGILKLHTDEGVSVVLESPAEFRFTGPDEIVLNYGRLFASVSNSENGFSVQTNSARIIDLGTEFGVYADTRGKVELHVYKGKTALIADIENQKKVLDVTEGQARELDNVYNEVRPIQLDPGLFVRNIESQARLVWRHEDKFIDLADVIGGGNGDGGGNKDRAIQWDGSKLLYRSEMPALSKMTAPYVPVRCSPFIDGIFIPSGKGEKPLTLSSDPALLNLDEFLRRDTNGLVTLMLLHDQGDIDADYWFCSRQGAADDPWRMPSLFLPNLDGGASVTTGDLRGADAYVANDILNAPQGAFGSSGAMSVRYFKDHRIRIMYLRFDISRLGGDLSGAILKLYLNSGNRNRLLQVYGLQDGPADLWNEQTISFLTAPGLLPAAAGNYQLDESLCEKLGTFQVVDNRIAAEPIPVTADGTVTWTAPRTSHQSAYAISNAGSLGDGGQNGAALTLRLAGQPCGTRENPSLLMHANAGITFDLEAFRRVYGDGSLKAFTAVCGLSPAPGQIAQDNAPRASFFVLVDGQEVFSAIDLSAQDTPQPIDIKLNDFNRFLTLVTTQGADNTIDNDLCLFARPRIAFQ